MSVPLPSRPVPFHPTGVPPVPQAPTGPTGSVSSVWGPEEEEEACPGEACLSPDGITAGLLPGGRLV